MVAAGAECCTSEGCATDSNGKHHEIQTPDLNRVGSHVTML